jgi:hypothetical protein
LDTWRHLTLSENQSTSLSTLRRCRDVVPHYFGRGHVRAGNHGNFARGISRRVSTRSFSFNVSNRDGFPPFAPTTKERTLPRYDKNEKGSPCGFTPNPDNSRRFLGGNLSASLEAATSTTATLKRCDSVNDIITISSSTLAQSESLLWRFCLFSACLGT